MRGKKHAQKVAGVDDDDKKKKRRSSRPKGSFHIYVNRVLKQVHPELGLSKRSASIMNSFVMDIFARLSQEAGQLSKMNGKSTFDSRAVQTAVRLVLPGELAKHAVSEGTKAVQKFSAS